MSDLVAFLTARLDEDEAWAKAADLTAGGTWFSDPGIPSDGFNLPDAQHMMRHSPARVLREVDAKRKILALHAALEPEFRPGRPPLLRCSVCLSQRDGWQEDWHGDDWPCPTVVALAAVYSDHHDYDHDWTH